MHPLRRPDALDPAGRFPEGLAAVGERMGGRAGMGNFIQHMGKWRSDTVYARPPFPASYNWRVHEEAGGAGASGRGSGAWVSAHAACLHFGGLWV